jgi:AAA15 family ATPase/GTPase
MQHIEYMRYKSFRVQNFKGIKDATINFSNSTGSQVYTLVGLNESGKTTILEAIYSFSPDNETSEVLGGDKGIGVPISNRVPRHQISNFTGAVVVEALLSVTKQEWDEINIDVKKELGIELQLDELPTEIKFERRQEFKSGDYYKSSFVLLSQPLVCKTNIKKKKWRTPTTEENKSIRDTIFGFTPDIAYFPTFVFDFPESFYLSERGGKLDKFYRSVFQDILDHDGNKHSIEKDIVNRVRKKDHNLPWTNFLQNWIIGDDKTKVQHIIDRAGATVTKIVLGRWEKIFKEKSEGKEVVVTFEVDEGEILNAQGIKQKTEAHDVWVKFQIKDGTRRFNINDRSLGFRWFFSFMLFTQFRVSGTNDRPLLFLFDEPASNLHASAQQKLVECFPSIAVGEHTLIYTTHSHHMIDPRWLENTFVVTNRSDSPTKSLISEATLDDESLDVKIATYRSFVNLNPGRTSYFQPILDRLDVVPSRFDLQKRSLIVEGKSDYYILSYAAKLLQTTEIPIIPGLGAGTFGALVSLHIGWGLKCLFLFDGDHQGKMERDRYVHDYGLNPSFTATLDQLLPNIIKIEDIIDQDSLKIIQTELSLENLPKKGEILRYFQEKLSLTTVPKLGTEFNKISKTLLERIALKLAE